MTRKHFEAIAAIINSNADYQVQDVAEELASYFKSENPRFDRDRFMTACGF